MSVYTPLTLEQVQVFAKPYGLEVVELQPIQGGIENTNYFLTVDSGQQYVLTIFELLDTQGANELPPILKKLGQDAVPVAVPLLYAEQFIHQLENKPAQIAPKISGEHPDIPNTLQIQAIAQAQAQLHLSLKDTNFKRKFSRNHDYWTAVAQGLKPTMSDEDLALLDDVYRQFNQIKQRYSALPQGWIHSDLFRDNTLFKDNALEGILDFSEMHQGDFLFDIAICMNDFCQAYPSEALDLVKVNTFIEAYSLVRPVTKEEIACLPIYLAMAACRFWLMRLQVAQLNNEQGRVGDDIMQKDPNEMRAKLRNRLSAAM